MKCVCSGGGLRVSINVTKHHVTNRDKKYETLSRIVVFVADPDIKKIRKVP